MFHHFASVGASTILRCEVRIVFPGCLLVMLASNFDNLVNMLVSTAGTHPLDLRIVPNLESPVMSVDSMVNDVSELIIGLFSLSSLPASGQMAAIRGHCFFRFLKSGVTGFSVQLFSSQFNGLLFLLIPVF